MTDQAVLHSVTLSPPAYSAAPQEPFHRSRRRSRGPNRSGLGSTGRVHVHHAVRISTVPRRGANQARSTASRSTRTSQGRSGKGVNQLSIGRLNKEKYGAIYAKYMLAPAAYDRNLTCLCEVPCHIRHRGMQFSWHVPPPFSQECSPPPMKVLKPSLSIAKLNLPTLSGWGDLETCGIPAPQTEMIQP